MSKQIDLDLARKSHADVKREIAARLGIDVDRNDIEDNRKDKELLLLILQTLRDQNIGDESAEKLNV